jgi:hypothetical protein
MNRRKQMTDAELEQEDNFLAAREARDRRLFAVQEKLEAIGIDIDELIELIEERQARARY